MRKQRLGKTRTRQTEVEERSEKDRCGNMEKEPETRKHISLEQEAEKLAYRVTDTSSFHSRSATSSTPKELGPLKSSLKPNDS